MSCTMPTSRASSSPVMATLPRPWSASRTYTTASRMPRARGDASRRPRSAADHKVGPPAARAGPRHGHLAYVRAARPAMGPGDQRLHRVALTADLRLDAAIFAVLHPADDAEPAGLALHRAAVPDALHAAPDHQMRDDGHARTSLRNSSSSRRVMPSFSARASLEPGSSPTTT